MPQQSAAQEDLRAVMTRYEARQIKMYGDLVVLKQQLGSLTTAITAVSAAVEDIRFTLADRPLAFSDVSSPASSDIQQIPESDA